MRISQLNKINEGLQRRYDLKIAFIGNTKRVQCFFVSVMSEQTEDAMFMLEVINIELRKCKSVNCQYAAIFSL